MKKSPKIIALIISILLLATSVHAKKEETTKIGYIDLYRVFNEYYKTKDSKDNLEKKALQKNKEREGMVTDIKKVQEEAELLSEKEKGKKESVIENKLKGLQDFDRAVKDELTRESDSMERDLLLEVFRGVESYGKSKNYDLILNDRALFYGSERMDISNEVIKYINQNPKR